MLLQKEYTMQMCQICGVRVRVRQKLNHPLKFSDKYMMNYYRKWGGCPDYYFFKSPKDIRDIFVGICCGSFLFINGWFFPG
jgi:hypothetical protein